MVFHDGLTAYIIRVQGTLDDHYKPAQLEELSAHNSSRSHEMLLSGALTDRPRYEAATMKTEKITVLDRLVEVSEDSQIINQLPCAAENCVGKDDLKTQTHIKQKLSAEDKSLKECFKELVKAAQEEKQANVGHRRTKSSTEALSQAKQLLLGPKKINTLEAAFNKRHYIIRKSYGSENPQGLESPHKIVERTSEKNLDSNAQLSARTSVQPTGVFGEPKLSTQRNAFEKDGSPQRKKEEPKGDASPISAFIKSRVATLTNLKEDTLQFSKLNFHISSYHRTSTNPSQEKNSIRMSFGQGKLNGSSVAASKILTTAETPRSVVQRPNPLANRRQVLVLDELKTIDQSLSYRNTERASPLVTDRLEEDKIYLSPRYDIPHSFGNRRGGKATSVNNLQEKSKQFKALNSIRRIRDDSKKLSSICDQRSQLMIRDSRDL